RARRLPALRQGVRRHRSGPRRAAALLRPYPRPPGRRVPPAGEDRHAQGPPEPGRRCAAGEPVRQPVFRGHALAGGGRRPGHLSGRRSRCWSPLPRPRRLRRGARPSPTPVSGADAQLGSLLPESFYARPADVVAPELLGKYLVVDRGDVVAAGVGRIVETEAYLGEEDLACHASKGLTARTSTIYGPPAHAYVYLI